MSCPASADLLQDKLLRTLHSSESYARSFGSFLSRCSKEQFYSLCKIVFLQRLLNNGAKKTSRHQTAVRSEAAATPNAGSDNLDQLNWKKSNLGKNI